MAKETKNTKKPQTTWWTDLVNHSSTFEQPVGSLRSLEPGSVPVPVGHFFSVPWAESRQRLSFFRSFLCGRSNQMTWWIRCSFFLVNSSWLEDAPQRSGLGSDGDVPWLRTGEQPQSVTGERPHGSDM